MVLIRVRVVAGDLTAIVALVILIRVRVVADGLIAVIADVILIGVRVVADDLTAIVALVVLIRVRALAQDRVADVAPVVLVGVGAGLDHSAHDTHRASAGVGAVAVVEYLTAPGVGRVGGNGIAAVRTRLRRGAVAVIHDVVEAFILGPAAGAGPPVACRIALPPCAHLMGMLIAVLVGKHRYGPVRRRQILASAVPRMGAAGAARDERCQYRAIAEPDAVPGRHLAHRRIFVLVAAGCGPLRRGVQIAAVLEAIALLAFAAAGSNAGHDAADVLRIGRRQGAHIVAVPKRQRLRGVISEHTEPPRDAAQVGKALGSKDLDLAGIVAVGDQSVAADLTDDAGARQLSGHGTEVGTAGDGEVAVGVAENAHKPAGRLTAGDSGGVDAVGDGDRSRASAQKAAGIAAGDGDAARHGQVLEDGIVRVSEKTRVIRGAVDVQVLDGMAAAVKDAAIGVLRAADGRPELVLQVDVRRQHGAGGVLRLTAAVDGITEEPQLLRRGDAVGVLLRAGARQGFAPLGGKGHVPVDGGVEVVDRAGSVQPRHKGPAVLLGVVRRRDPRALPDELLCVFRAAVPIGHGGGGDVGLRGVGRAVDHIAGIDGLAAELGVLVHGQPAIECAAGDVALRGDRAVERAAGEVAAEFPIVILGYVGHVATRIQHSDAAMENTAPNVARAGDIAGEDRGRLPVRVVDGVGGLDLTILIAIVASHIHRALHPAAVGIEEAAGIVDGIGRVKIHIDRGAVFDGACLGIVLFGGRAARDAGILPQLQLSKGDQGHAAAAFRLAAGDRSVQNRHRAVCVAVDRQAAAVVGGLAVLDAAAGDPDGTPGCQDAAAVLGRAAADDAAGHGDGAGLGIDRAAAGTVIG